MDNAVRNYEMLRFNSADSIGSGLPTRSAPVQI